MTITIPIWLLVVIGITLVWWAVGYAFNNTVLTRVKHQWLRKHKTGTVPNRFFYVAGLIAGPVGWAVAASYWWTHDSPWGRVARAAEREERRQRMRDNR